MTGIADRRARLRGLSESTFDLVVVGGGINGAGIAREAALRGLRTLVVDRGDFGGGTSSRSSKLIHGGLRYLETGDVALVREASLERDLLRRNLAPHLVRPMPFLFPVYRGARVGWWKLQAGLFVYDLLAGFRNIARHRALSAASMRREEPNLRQENCRGGALYYDCWTDDARLVIETLLAAEGAGALCLNYVAVESFERAEGRISAVVLRDVEGREGTVRVHARSVVNATGPWLDVIRRMDDPAAKPCLRPTKGVHLVVPRERLGNREALVLHAVRDGRVLFVIPWDEVSIVGTTDTDHEGPPETVCANDEDVDYLLETANHYFPRAELRDRDVISTFAGLRPLISGESEDAPSEISREEALFESSSGLLSIGGGKLTTYRRVAVKVVDRVASLLRPRGVEVRERSGTDEEPLPGARPPPPSARAARDACPDRSLVAHLEKRYGSRTGDVCEALRVQSEWTQEIVPGVADVLGQAWYSAATEWAITLDDVLRRRTSVALRSADHGVASAASVAAVMGEALGWDEATRAAKVREYVEVASRGWVRTSAERKKA